MADQGWKKFERRLSKMRLEGQRTGILGGEDIRSKYFSGEAKLWKKVPKSISRAYDQAKRNCPDKKIPFACIKEKGKWDKNALVILSLEHFDILARAYEERKERRR